MARKRLSSVAIEKLEQVVGNSTAKPESAVFGNPMTRSSSFWACR